MPRWYSTDQDVLDHMHELCDAKRPFKSTYKERNFWCISVPIKVNYGSMDVIMIKRTRDPEQSRGKRFRVEWEEFQQADWEPVDLPDDEWKPYLPD